MTVKELSVGESLIDVKDGVRPRQQGVVRLTIQEQQRLERLSDRVEEQSNTIQQQRKILEGQQKVINLQNSRITDLSRLTEEMQEQQGQQAGKIEVLGQRVNQAEGRVRQLERRQRTLEVVVCGCVIILVVVLILLL